VQAGVVVGRTQAEADARLAAYQAAASVEGVLAHAGLPFDPTAVPPQTPLRELAGAASGAGRFPVDLDQTAGEFLAARGDLARGPFFVAGTPEAVADEIERWLDETGIDGINLRQYHSFDTARDFVELVSPVLRARGRLRDGYPDGETLRDRIFGAGDRLPDRHRATRYRGGAGLPPAIG
jgi:alkanesulfonate monooxygenase SsuD/methylene tetrahydromethanopterin reductase-like flavin-dependent oxidoreductase (luciferase family)